MINDIRQLWFSDIAKRHFILEICKKGFCRIKPFLWNHWTKSDSDGKMMVLFYKCPSDSGDSQGREEVCYQFHTELENQSQ